MSSSSTHSTSNTTSSQLTVCNTVNSAPYQDKTKNGVREWVSGLLVRNRTEHMIGSMIGRVIGCDISCYTVGGG